MTVDTFNTETDENVVRVPRSILPTKPASIDKVGGIFPSSKALCFDLQVNLCPNLGQNFSDRLLRIIETSEEQLPVVINGFRKWFRPELIKRGLLEPKEDEKGLQEKGAICPNLKNDIARKYSTLIEELTRYQGIQE